MIGIIKYNYDIWDFVAVKAAKGESNHAPDPEELGRGRGTGLRIGG